MQLAERKMAAQVKHKTNCDFDFLHIEQIHLHSFNAYKTTINLIQIDYFQNIRTINAIFSQFNRIFGKQKFRIRFTIAITQWNLILLRTFCSSIRSKFYGKFYTHFTTFEIILLKIECQFLF